MARLIRNGTRGEDVKSLQTKLNNAGHNSGKVDGIVGPITSGAIREFQKANGLAVDGIAGPKTMAALNNLEGKTSPEKAVEKKEENKEAVTELIFDGEYTIKEIQDSLDAMYKKAPKLIKARAERLKKMIDNAGERMKEIYVQSKSD